MPGLTTDILLIVGLASLAVHMLTVALTKALRSYSRSRLVEYCTHRGRPERALEVEHQDTATERATEALAVVSGLLLMGFLGVLLSGSSLPTSLTALVVLTIVVGGLGYALAGGIGKVLAEPILDALWPFTPFLRAAAWPLAAGSEVIEHATDRLAARSGYEPRPASVEVEFDTEEGETPEDVDVDIPDFTRAVIQRVVDLSRATVSEIMVPSSAIVSLPSTVTAHAAADTIRRTGRSRVPVYGANRDDIVGILLGKDLWQWMVLHDKPSATIPPKVLRRPFFVPDTADAFHLLDELRSNRTQMAIVLDEYGGVAGLITLEDLLEQFVGPIDDEHDIPTPTDPITPLGGSQYEVDATLPLEILNDRFDLHLPTEEDFQTVGGLAFHALGRLPEPGATFRHDGVEFTVLDLHDHAIGRVRINLHPVASPVENG